MAHLLADTAYWNTLWVEIFSLETVQERQEESF